MSSLSSGGSLTDIINRQAEIIRNAEEEIGRLNGSKACLNIEISQLRGQVRNEQKIADTCRRERDALRRESPDLDAYIRQSYNDGYQLGYAWGYDDAYSKMMADLVKAKQAFSTYRTEGYSEGYLAGWEDRSHENPMRGE